MYNYPKLTSSLADKDAVLKKLAEEFKDAKTDTLDGLTAQSDTAWFNVRPSNTEPLLRLNAEAKTKQELDTLVSKVTGANH